MGRSIAVPPADLTFLPELLLYIAIKRIGTTSDLVRTSVWQVYHCRSVAGDIHFYMELAIFEIP